MFAWYRKLKNKITRWLAYEPKNVHEYLPYDFRRLKHEIKPGDVLLIEGRSHISSVIRTITQSSWTHAALYIGRIVDIEDKNMQEKIRAHVRVNDHTRLVLEDLMDKGTVITPLSKYRFHHMRICRPIGIIPEDVTRVIQYTLKALGQAYNVRQLLDLARFMLPWSILPRRWGSSLFRQSSGEPESGVCSSLLAEAFASVHFPILPAMKHEDNQRVELYQRNPYLFTPKDFDFSPYFEIVKYPLFNPEQPLPYYRRLPWTRTGMVYQDHGIVSKPFVKIKKNKDEENPKS